MRSRKKIILLLARTLLSVVAVLVAYFLGLVVYKTIRPPTEGMLISSQYLILRDGVKIAIDLYLPENFQAGEKIPTILDQTIYWRSFDISWPFNLFFPANAYEAEIPGIHRRFVTEGYAWVSVDVRGTGASYGCQTSLYPQAQIEDAREIVDWIIRQPWSDGQVGGWGISYGAGAADYLMAIDPPAVKAIVPAFMGYDYYSDLAFPGGVYYAWGAKAWADGAAMMNQNQIALPFPVSLFVRGVKPVDEDDHRTMLAEAVTQHGCGWDAYETTLGITFRDDPLPYEWGSSIDRESPFSDAQSIQLSSAAAYFYTGWYDGAYAHAGVKRFLNTPGNRLIIGPWDHGGVNNLSPTVLSRNTFDHIAELRRFFDHYLKGVDTGIQNELPVRYYTLVEDQWKYSATWPPAEVQNVPYYFGPGNTLVSARPGILEGYDEYHVSYATGTGTLTRWKSLVGGLPSPEAYPDRDTQDALILTYTSSPLSQPLELTGHPVVTLCVSSNAKDGNFFVYLEDVDPNGYATYITEGLFRAIHRKLSSDQPLYRDVVPYHTYRRVDALPLVPGEVAELVFDLEPISYMIRQGHAIRIALAGADKDAFYVPPGEPPTLCVVRDQGCASKIDLPVMPRK